MRLQHLYIISGLVLLLACLAVEALVCRLPPKTSLLKSDAGHRQRPLLIRAIPGNYLGDDEEEEVFSYDQRSRFFVASTSQNNSTSQANYLDDLTPPPINIARDSILFSENPATKRNNAFLQVWKLCRQYLPPICTGEYPWRDTSITERNPLGALYNMVLVRIPTMVIGAVYFKNLWEGHPLIMDFGQGAFEMSPIVVISVLALILA